MPHGGGLMRRTTTLAIGFALITWTGVAAARTPGAVCRQECRPRILEQCAGRVGGELRRCRRSLVRACKATTPAVACPTTEDLTRELSDRRFSADDATARTVLLCTSGDFTLKETTHISGSISSTSTRTGTWNVQIAGNGL